MDILLHSLATIFPKTTIYEVQHHIKMARNSTKEGLQTRFLVSTKGLGAFTQKYL